jgi:hypothetical protein
MLVAIRPRVPIGRARAELSDGSTRQEGIMSGRTSGRFHPLDHPGTDDLESLIRAEYERCHPDDTFDDLKRRARFAKEDKGLLQDWLAIARARAASRAAASDTDKAARTRRLDAEVALQHGPVAFELG